MCLMRLPPSRRTESLSASERIAKIEQLLTDYEALQSDQVRETLQQSELFLEQQTDTAKTYDELEKRSVSLQLRVSSILKALVFDTTLFRHQHTGCREVLSKTRTACWVRAPR